MTNRSQKRKAAEEPVLVSIETPIAENSQVENLVAGPNKTTGIHPENLD